jgi:predicted Rossmann-fold nucleotide-binding protein
MEETRFPTLRERLWALIERCDVALALPGGAGTLAEISLMWNLLITGAISPRPLILIGRGWQTVLESFYAALGQYTTDRDRAWLSFAQDIEEAVGRI